jgi:hypothetical protein
LPSAPNAIPLKLNPIPVAAAEYVYVKYAVAPVPSVVTLTGTGPPTSVTSPTTLADTPVTETSLANAPALLTASTIVIWSPTRLATGDTCHPRLSVVAACTTTLFDVTTPLVRVSPLLPSYPCTATVTATVPAPVAVNVYVKLAVAVAVNPGPLNPLIVPNASTPGTVPAAPATPVTWLNVACPPLPTVSTAVTN